MAKKFIQKTWNGLTNFDGRYIWSDGENIYYSSTSTQYVLDKSTSTWEPKTWSGLTDFDGNNIWSDGTNYYYSYKSSEWNPTKQYVLDKSTSTWEPKTWSGLTDFDGANIWSDGINIYYSGGSDHYVLDKSTSTWTTKTWTGLGPFTGNAVWTDGENIYYSSGSVQRVLDKSTGTWEPKTWSGLTTPSGNQIWIDGENIYYSGGSKQYVLDKSTSTWESKTWDDLTSFYGNKIWTDGTNIYYSDASTQYVYAEDKHYLSTLTLPITVNGTTTNVEFTLKDAEARQMIEELGHALYWMGVTTTEMSDGLSTADVVINGETVTPNIGGLVSYSGSEFVWNGSAWQEFGKNNFGDLAFKSSAEGSYTPAGSVAITQGTDTTASVTGIASVGTLPEAYFTVSGETATFNFSQGTLPTTDASATTVITARGTDTAAFTGTAATITVS